MSAPEDVDGLPPVRPSLERLEQLVQLAERRCRRAQQKLEVAITESADASACLSRAIQARTDWIENNPDPQIMML